MTLFSEASGRRWTGPALVDTGAQFAMIHPVVIDDLGLTAMGESEIDTAIGLSRTRAYILRVAVADVFDGKLSALETKSRERFVLGRQFLQSLRLEADWPKGTFVLQARA